MAERLVMNVSEEMAKVRRRAAYAEGKGEGGHARLGGAVPISATQGRAASDCMRRAWIGHVRWLHCRAAWHLVA